MASVDADLICGACTNLLRDPYNLPCGHTFCLRPCLLPHAKAKKSHCIRCDATFDASQLRPNYTIGARLYLLSSEQEEKQKQDWEQQIVDNDEGVEKVQNDGMETNEKPSSLIMCSVCRKVVNTKVLGICLHCYRNICPQCREKHHESYRLIVRVKLNSLNSQKAILKSRLVQMQGSRSSLPETEKNTKDKLLDALEGAVMELRTSASKSLNSALAKLEMMEMAGHETLNPLVLRITNLVTEINKVGDVSASLKPITSLQEVVAKQQWLRSLLAEAAPLKEMMANLPPLPITQINLSGLLNKIDRHISGLNLFMGDDMMPFPQLSPPNDTGKQRGIKTSLFVRGLRPSHTESQVRQHFAHFGTVIRCIIPRNSTTGENRGFGFVVFQEAADADRVLAERVHFIEGYPVHVNPSKEKPKKENRKQMISKSTSMEKAKPPNDRKTAHQLVIHDIPPKTSKKAVRALLGRCGMGASVKVDQKEKEAFVSFSTAKALQTAMEAAPYRLSNVNLRVSLPANSGAVSNSTE